MIGAAMSAVQRRLIYFPSRDPVPPAADVLRGGEDIALTTEDGMRLGAWFVPAGPGAPTVLICNGNAGDRSGRAALALLLHRMGLAVLTFDYRGYGGNPGTPSESGLALDARAARAFLADRDGGHVDPQRIVYFGESLGAAVSLRLALEAPPAALVLCSPFTSLTEVGALHYPWLPVQRLLSERYPSIDRIPRLTAPLLVIAGEADTLVPAEMSRRLYDAATSVKRFVLVPGAEHGSPELHIGTVLADALAVFLRENGITPATGGAR